MRRIAFSFLVVGLFASGCVKGPGRARTPSPPAEAPPAVTPAEIDLVPLAIEATADGAGPKPVRGVAFGYGVESGARNVLFSRSCAGSGGAAIWYCAGDRWLVGETRGRSIEHPNAATRHVIGGVDLGISVRFGPEGRTFVYMGDTVGKPTMAGCGLRPDANVCNDAILVLAGPDDDALRKDDDPDQGLSANIAVRRRADGAIEGFVPIVIPGVNGRNPLPFCGKRPAGDRAPCLGRFNVPTGAVAAPLPAALLPGADRAAQGATDAVLLWYGTAIAMFDDSARDPARHGPRSASWLAVSTDGLRFERLLEAPFSRDKFIQVAPVLVRAAVRGSLCQKDAASPLCDAALGADADILLLFGTGERYRKSPLYLGAMRLSDLSVLYYRSDPTTGAESWSRDEADATPIVGRSHAHEPGGKKRAGAESPVDELFGELSVKLMAEDACAEADRASCADTLVLLANHGPFVRYRTAPLASPGARGWSKSSRTSAVGYGPYLIEPLMRVERGADGRLELRAFHVISSWDGRPLDSPDRNPYGVFTRRLKLIDEASCKADRKSLVVCDEIAPPWPPAAAPPPAAPKDQPPGAP